MNPNFIRKVIHVKNVNETYTGLYKKYKWENGKIAANIRAKKLTPILPYTSDDNGKKNVMCQICYNFYPLMNLTKCCHQMICTECIAATVSPTEMNCPFCRKSGFHVTPNQTINELKDLISDDEQYEKYEKEIRDGFKEEDVVGCTDDAIQIAMSFNVPPKNIQELLDNGIPSEDIIVMLDSKGNFSNKNEPDVQKTANSQNVENKNMYEAQQVNTQNTNNTNNQQIKEDQQPKIVGMTYSNSDSDVIIVE